MRTFSTRLSLAKPHSTRGGRGGGEKTSSNSPLMSERLANNLEKDSPKTRGLPRGGSFGSVQKLHGKTKGEVVGEMSTLLIISPIK